MVAVADLVEGSDTLKAELLQSAGLEITSPLPLRKAEDVDTALCCARIACLSSDETYFLTTDADFRREINPRNEAAAIALLYTKLREAGDKAGAAALSAHAPALSKAAQRGGGGAGPGDAPATALLDSDAASPDAEMMRWAEAQGIRARIRPASFAGLRGAAASAAIRADEPAVEVPASALITLRTAMESELGPLLKILPGLDSDSALTLWTMYDRVCEESTRGPFWKALPETIATGVTMPLGSALKGLPIAEEARVLRAELEARHAQLFPALFKAAPGLFEPQEAFSLQAFLWAAQLWMAYAIKVLLPGEEEPEPALVPVALLANHALRPDIVRFSRVDDDGVLRLRVIRGVPQGAEVALSYGPLPNTQLLLFYGFALRSNPFDSIPLAFDLPTDDNRATGKLRAAVLRWAGVGLDEHSIRGGPAGGVLSPRLLTALQLLSASQGAIGGLAAGNGLGAPPPPPPAAAAGAGKDKKGKGKGKGAAPAAAAAPAEEEEEAGPDPAAAAGTREAARRAAAVEAECGSKWAANALKSTVDAQSKTVAACLAAAAKRAAAAASASGAAEEPHPAKRPALEGGGPGPKAGEKGGAAGGGAGAKSGPPRATVAAAEERLDAAGELFVLAVLEGQKACLDAASAQIAILEKAQ